MDSQHYSQEIRQLTHKFVKSMIERTKGNLKTSVPFTEAYANACYLAGKTKDEDDTSSLQIRYHVRDNLLTNNLILVNPDDVDSIFITQKAIDDYNALSEEKW